jgi:hypothetical protein
MALRTIPINVGGGPNCSWVVEKDGQNAQEYAETDDVTDFGSDGQEEAMLSWTQQRAAVRVTGLAMATSRNSETGNQVLVARNIINSASKLASLMNGRIFSGNGAASPKQITGLDTAIGDDSNTYANLSRVTHSFWRPTIIDPGALTPISWALIRDDQTKIEDACGERPDMAYVPPGVFNSIVSTFDASRRFVESLETPRGKINFASGQAVEVEGTVFIKDKDATANRIYYCNSEYFWLEVLPASDEAVPVLEPGTILRANDGFGELPLMFTYEKLAKTGDSSKFFAKCYAQLKVEKPNAFGVRKNVKTL